MTTPPTVSVVIPVRDRRDLLVDAVDSVCHQTLAPIEIVVVDDGSTDGSADAVAGRAPSLRVVRQPGRGRSAARNRGIEESHGSLVAFLDSDDTWLPDKLERQVAAFADDRRVGLVTGHVVVVDDTGLEVAADTRRYRRGLDRFVKLGGDVTAGIRCPGMYTSSVVVRREALDDVGWFDADMSANEDWDFYLRVARRWRIQAVPWPPIVRYRRHGGNTSNERMAESTITVALRNLTAHPPLPRPAQAHLLVKQARAHRILGQEGAARHALMGAARADPGAAVMAGAPRLLVGSLLSGVRRKASP